MRGLLSRFLNFCDRQRTEGYCPRCGRKPLVARICGWLTIS